MSKKARIALLPLVVLVAGFVLCATTPLQAQSIEKRVKQLQNDVAQLKGELSALDARVTTDESRLEGVEGQVTALEADLQPLSLSVDCAAGQTVTGALEQAGVRPAHVEIVISGFCREDVYVHRHNTTLRGAAAGDGMEMLALDGHHGHWLEQLTLDSLYVQKGASVRASGLVMTSKGSVAVWHASGIFLDSVLGGPLFVDSGGSVECHRCVLDGSQNEFGGARASAGGSITFWGTTIRGAQLGVYVYGGASVKMVDGTVEQNEVGFMVNDGHLELRNTVVRQNSNYGISIWPGTAMINGGEVTGNGWGIIAWGAALEVSDTAIRQNAVNGISVLGTDVVLRGVTVSDNHGSGINLEDVSVLHFGGANQVVNNDGWGLYCEPAPAVAMYKGDPALVTVTNNGAGDISCPTPQ